MSKFAFLSLAVVVCTLSSSCSDSRPAEQKPRAAAKELSPAHSEPLAETKAEATTLSASKQESVGGIVSVSETPVLETKVTRYDFENDADLRQIKTSLGDPAIVRNNRLVVGRNDAGWISITLVPRLTVPFTFRMKARIRDGLFLVYPATTPDGREFPSLSAAEAASELQVFFNFSEKRNTEASIGIVGLSGVRNKFLRRVDFSTEDDRDHLVEVIITQEHMQFDGDQGLKILDAPLPTGSSLSNGQLRIVKYVPSSGSFEIDWMEFEESGVVPSAMAKAKPSAPGGSVIDLDVRAESSIRQPAKVRTGAPVRESVRKLTDEEQATRESALNAVEVKEKPVIAALSQEIAELEKELQIADDLLKKAMKSIGTVKKPSKTQHRLVASKAKTRDDKSQQIDTARKELNDRLVEFADERGAIKVRYPVEGDLHQLFEGHYLPVLQIASLQAERRAAELRREEIERGPNGTAQKAAELHVQGLLNNGTLQAATTAKLHRAMIYIGTRGRDGLADVAVENISKSGDLLPWLVFFNVRYVSKAGIVNERLVYVLVVKKKSGMWECYRDPDVFFGDPPVYYIDENGKTIPDGTGGSQTVEEMNLLKGAF